MSKLLQEKDLGLPEVMEDDFGCTLEGVDAVTVGAAQYIASRGHDREERTRLPAKYYQSIEKRCTKKVADLRAEWRQQWNGQHQPYAMRELEEAVRRIDVKSTCAGIPYVATKVAQGAIKEYLLAHQNFMLFLRVVPSSAKRQPTYHKHKAHRPRRRFASYRTLSLSADELRLAEELWASRSEAAIWAAACSEQMGR